MPSGRLETTGLVSTSLGQLYDAEEESSLAGDKHATCLLESTYESYPKSGTLQVIFSSSRQAEVPSNERAAVGTGLV